MFKFLNLIITSNKNSRFLNNEIQNLLLTETLVRYSSGNPGEYHTNGSVKSRF
jgi:hypothetical protein